jgi:tetratricopeptide (TPR) repeat protein
MTAGSIRFSGEARLNAMRQLAGLLREGVRRRPDAPQNWRTLSHILCRLGHATEAIAHADEALTRFPGDIELRATRIGARIQLGDVDSALADARSLWDASPESPIAGRAYLEALAAAGLWDDLAPAASSMEWVGSNPKFSLEILARRSLVIEDRPEEILAHCDAILARSPGHTDATYYRAIALARVGRDAEACEAMGLERYLSISELPVPEGYADGQAFRGVLAAEIRANPTLVPDPKLKTTRDGLQTLQLRQPDDKAVPALAAAIEIAVAGYVAGLAGDAGSFATAVPETAEIQSWAILYGRDGRQKPHRHPGGWLSGVYYVSAPKRPGENAYSGMLKVGMVGKVCAAPPWGIRDIEPVPGRLVMFPSYTPHATEPTAVAGARISVAFDVVPSPKN